MIGWSISNLAWKAKFGNNCQSEENKFIEKSFSVSYSSLADMLTKYVFTDIHRHTQRLCHCVRLCVVNAHRQIHKHALYCTDTNTCTHTPYYT